MVDEQVKWIIYNFKTANNWWVTVKMSIQVAGLFCVTLVLSLLCTICRTTWQQHTPYLSRLHWIYLSTYFTFAPLSLWWKSKSVVTSVQRLTDNTFNWQYQNGELTRPGWEKMNVFGVTESLSVTVLISSLCEACVPSMSTVEDHCVTSITVLPGVMCQKTSASNSAHLNYP